MEITFHPGHPAATAGSYATKIGQREPAVVHESTALATSRSLMNALKQAAPVRQDVVRRAKALVGDPSYPPPETIRQVSYLLANQMHPER